MLVLYRARWTFLGETRSLLDTGRLMARWAEEAAALFAPELEWSGEVQVHSDFELAARWETSHVVRLAAGESGGGESRLVAGGRGKRIGGSGRVLLRTADPLRFFEADGHCDVTHWDVRASGATRATIDGIRALLEEEIGANATIGDEHATEYERGPRLVARTTDEADAYMWLGDLDDVGLPARVTLDGETFEVRVEASELETLATLDEARITLGEVLAEAGEEDWAEAAMALLAQLPSRSM